MKRIRSARKRPLLTQLVERGIFVTEDEARGWIMTGQVLVNDQVVDKPGMLVPLDAVFRVLRRHRYASRGGYKLEAALRYFSVEVTGRVALDSGASTGGFTDCLLQNGAALVYAVEVGYGQLLGRLRIDSRVHNLERTNLSDMITRRLDPSPTLITLDLSYLSLTKALPIAATLLAPRGDVLALLKPLFEVESAVARRTGQVEDPALLVAALYNVLDAGKKVELVPQGAAKLALQPRHGVNEFFVYFSRGTDSEYWEYNEATLINIVGNSGIGSIEEE